jgi:hypothetical protein
MYKLINSFIMLVYYLQIFHHKIHQYENHNLPGRKLPHTFICCIVACYCSFCKTIMNRLVNITGYISQKNNLNMYNNYCGLAF